MAEETKKCQGPDSCGRELPLENFWSHRKKKQLKSGEIREYVSHERLCRECLNEKKRNLYATDPEFRAKVDASNEKWRKKNRKKVRDAKRDWVYLQRRLNLVPERGPRIPRHNQRKQVSAQPLIDFVEARACARGTWPSDDLRREYSRAVETAQTDYFTADTILTALGYPGAARTLYPGV